MLYYKTNTEWIKIGKSIFVWCGKTVVNYILKRKFAVVFPMVVEIVDSRRKNEREIFHGRLNGNYSMVNSCKICYGDFGG